MNVDSQKSIKRLNIINYGLIVAVLVTAQCSVFEPPKIPDSGPKDGAIDAPGAKDSGADVGSETGPDSMTAKGPLRIVTDEHGCESVRAPNRADRPDSRYEGESLAPIYLAMSRIRFGTTNDDKALTMNTEAWRDIGVDRDERCTNSPTCEVNGQRVDEPSCKSEVGVNPEGNRCIDNAMGNLFAMGTLVVGVAYSPRELFGMSDPDWNCELHRGGFSMIFKISDYNGLDNDPLVRLDMYVSSGLQELPVWTCRDTIESTLNENWYDNPPWLARMHWKIARRSISPSAQSAGEDVPDANAFDAQAFVRDGFLFAELPDRHEFAFAGDRTPIPGIRTFIHKSILLARLFRDPDNKAWRMDDGLLSCLIVPDEFVASIREIGFCKNICGTYDAMKSYLYAAQDVLLTGASQPDTPCTALSFAADFEASQATATANDVEDIAEPVDCPQPRHADAPRQECICQEDGTCVEPLPNGGI